jgi:hypothetical protein
VTIKKKNIAKLASLSALGAGAAMITAKDAQAGIVYTRFTPPDNTVGLSANGHFTVSSVIPGGFGGFALFRTSTYNPRTSNSHTFSFSYLLKIVLSGFSGLKFQTAPGIGAMWIPSLGNFTYKTLRSKRTIYKVTYTQAKYTPLTNGKTYTTYGPPNPHYLPPTTSVLKDQQGDFFLLFQFSPSGNSSQVDYGWLHLYGHCNCGLDTEAIELAFDDSGALIGAGQTPEPATAIPTGLGALALGATGLRRWRKSRKQAA